MTNNNKFKLKINYRTSRLLFILGALVVGVILKYVLAYDGKQIADVFVTLAAVYFGAYFAFSMNERRQVKTDSDRNVKDANFAIFTLLQLLNSLDNYLEKIIGPVRGHELRLLSMPPYMLGNQFLPKIDTNSLGFMLADTQNVNLLAKIIIEEKQFHTIAFNIEERAKLHIGVAQPAMEAAGFTESTSICLDDIKTALGDRAFGTLQRTTDEIIQDVDETRANLQQLISEFYASCRKLYPSYGFLRIMEINDDTE